jgi:quercetin dioxygenase-like cupin family protein
MEPLVTDAPVRNRFGLEHLDIIDPIDTRDRRAVEEIIRRHIGQVRRHWSGPGCRNTACLPSHDHQTGGDVNIVRAADRPIVARRPPLPTIQRLVDSDAGAQSTTIIVNKINEGQLVPTHQHDVEEILLVTAGQCLVTVGDDNAVVTAGDAVIIPPGTDHAIRHVNQTADVIGVLASPTAALNTPAE